MKALTMAYDSFCFLKGKKKHRLTTITRAYIMDCNYHINKTLILQTRTKANQEKKKSTTFIYSKRKRVKKMKLNVAIEPVSFLPSRSEQRNYPEANGRNMSNKNRSTMV